MALPATPRLRVIDGGSDAMRRDEARIEALSLMDEVVAFAIEAQPVLNEWQTNLTKLARRVALARGEVMTLQGGSSDDAA